jgi:putative tryptophan/tyrosine transport system substrate-binding protein
VDRRRFLLTSLASVVTVPLAAEAQQAGRIWRLGMLVPAARPDPSVASSVNLVPMALHTLGYIEGQNLVIERRFAEGRMDRLQALARELVLMRVDVILAVSEEATAAAKEATTAIPIVMGFGSNPVERGFAVSLSRPGGNVTGVLLVPEGQLASKRLELLKEALPASTRIAVLATRESSVQAQLHEAQTAAPRLGVQLLVTEVMSRDYDRAFTLIAAQRADGLFVLASPIFNVDRKDIITRAAQYRLPAMYEWREQVEAGGLMSYGSSVRLLSARVANYVHRILGGTRPADLPIEQPTKYELTLNLRTAKALGLTIPPSLLARADQVIE